MSQILVSSRHKRLSGGYALQGVLLVKRSSGFLVPWVILGILPGHWAGYGESKVIANEKGLVAVKVDWLPAEMVTWVKSLTPY